MTKRSHWLLREPAPSIGVRFKGVAVVDEIGLGRESGWSVLCPAQQDADVGVGRAPQARQDEPVAAEPVSFDPERGIAALSRRNNRAVRE